MKLFFTTISVLLFISIEATAANDSWLKEYKDVEWEKYNNATAGISLQYPYSWQKKPGLKRDEIFYVSGETLFPSISIAIFEQSKTVSFEDSGKAAARQLNSAAEIISDQEINFNGVRARRVEMNWNLPIGLGIELTSVLFSIYNNKQWIIVRASDGRTHSGFSELLTNSIQSVKFFHISNN